MVVVVSPDDEASGFTHILTGPLAHCECMRHVNVLN